MSNPMAWREKSNGTVRVSAACAAAAETVHPMASAAAMALAFMMSPSRRGVVFHLGMRGWFLHPGRHRRPPCRRRMALELPPPLTNAGKRERLMTELDLLNLGRATTQNEIGDFTQVITINFAMIVAIYYFLNRAQTTMKVFAFFAYMVGMAMFIGQMLLETSMKYTVREALKALPNPSRVTQEYIGLSGTWLGIGTSLLFNVAIWILWLGVFYLLFFWKKAPDER